MGKKKGNPICVDCGESFEGHGGRKYCDVCIEKPEHRNRKLCRQEHFRKRRTEKHFCVDCGAELLGHRNRRYCETCVQKPEHWKNFVVRKDCKGNVFRKCRECGGDVKEKHKVLCFDCRMKVIKCYWCGKERKLHRSSGAKHFCSHKCYRQFSANLTDEMKKIDATIEGLKRENAELQDKVEKLLRLEKLNDYLIKSQQQQIDLLIEEVKDEKKAKEITGDRVGWQGNSYQPTVVKRDLNV